LFSAEAPLDRSIVYYNSDRHSLSPVGRCPGFESFGTRADARYRSAYWLAHPVTK
jgi:hypothetical protein